MSPVIVLYKFLNSPNANRAAYQSNFACDMPQVMLLKPSRLEITINILALMTTPALFSSSAHELQSFSLCPRFGTVQHHGCLQSVLLSTVRTER